MKFILIRHAQSAPKADSHQSEWGLTAAGERSCRDLADYLQAEKVHLIASSDEVKAVQTAEFTAKILACDTAIVPDLREQNNDGVGWFESADDFRTAVQTLFEQPDHAVFGPETASQAAERFGRALNDIVQKHGADGTIAAVTHGRVMTSFLQAHQAVDAVPFWRSLTFPDCVTTSWPDVKTVGRRSFP